MATLKDIARSIANSENLTGRNADAFVTAIVDTILEGLERDRLVKIKGFGTFKLTAVRDRESINVNTGERVVISGHDKITFTPVDEVRDMINRPFAQFETVIVSKNVDVEKLNAVEDPVIETPVEDEPIIAEHPVNKQQVIEASVENESDTDEIPIIEQLVTEALSEDFPAIDESQETEQPVTEVPKEDEPVTYESSFIEQSTTETPSKDEQEATESHPESNEPEMLQIIEEPETDDDEQEHDSTNTFLICLFVGVLCFVAGYLCREYNVLSMISSGHSVATEPSAVPSDTLKDTITATTPLQAADTIITNETEQTEDAFEEKRAEEKEIEEGKKEEFDPKKYYNDSRVRTGAYFIVGIEKTVLVKPGQTLQCLSLIHLGPGMECYIEALNDTKEVKEGDVVKIPKLRLKKTNKVR